MTSLQSIIQNLLGTYEPIVTTLEDGSQTVSIDFEYILSALVFLICIYSIFRVLGGIICSNR